MKLTTTEKDPEKIYSSRIAVGDFVPYAYIKHENGVFDAQGKAGVQNILIFCKNVDDDTIKRALNLKVAHRHCVFIAGGNKMTHGRLFSNGPFFRLFNHPELPFSACVTDSNLKVTHVIDAQTLEELQRGLEAAQSQVHMVPPPVLIIPNVVDEALANDLIAYIDANAETGTVADKEFKRRLHVHPDRELTRRLDDKLSKSLLPEIDKVFYSPISHRETYKICKYSGANSGKFGKHRDTIFPHLHRRYAMTLVLNDNYEGGGIAFPEYNPNVLSVPKYGAVVFPGSLFHQVDPIQSGDRYVIISFFFTEAEAREKEGSERYRFTVHRDIGGIAINSLSPTQSDA